MEASRDRALNRMLEQAAEGDADAWQVLVGTYSRRVYGLLVRQCGDRELAEEITQATFVKVVSHIGRYREQGKFEPWLFRIAMNKLRDEMRRRKRQARSLDMSGGRTEEPGPWAAVEARIVERDSALGQDPMERASRSEQVEAVKRAVARLGPADQKILYLRHTAGLSFAQIAATLDEPLGTVLARGHRALAKLRKVLNEGGQAEETGPADSGKNES
jgi:RNA polymerase sigma-70 factor (ECF subfamily)